jgi:hypothetical protein
VASFFFSSSASSPPPGFTVAKSRFQITFSSTNLLLENRLPSEAKGHTDDEAPVFLRIRSLITVFKIRHFQYPESDKSNPQPIALYFYDEI